MRVYHDVSIPWVDPDAGADRPSRGVSTKKLAQGDCGFFLQTSIMPAGLRIEPHRHSADEVMIVLAGGCTLDDGTRLSAHDVAVIPSDTVYGFTVGDDGVRLLLVRGAAANIEFEQSEV